MTSRTRADIVLLVGVCGFLFFYGLAQFGLLGADEPRYAQVAREMLARGDWITPVLGGQPWLEKPPLYYWQAMIAFALFGVSDWAARLPSAVDASMMVAAIYLFYRRREAVVALDAALMAASCAGIIGYARAASMDMALAATFTFAMLAWWSWNEGREKTWLGIFYISLALGMLAKGPVAPLLAILVLTVYSAICGEFRQLRKTVWTPGILLFGVVSLPWYIGVQIRNPSFFRQFILQHNLARFSSDLYRHREPFWYYFPVTAIALLPWIVFVIAACVSAVRDLRFKSVFPESQFKVFVLFWLIVPVIFFSLSQSKLPGYILPAVPAGAIILAEYLRERLQAKEDRPASRGLIIFHALLASAPFAPALLLAYLVPQRHLNGAKLLLAAVACAVALAAGITLTLWSRAGLRMLRFVSLVPVLLSVAAVLKMGAWTLDRSLSARPVAQAISEIELHPLPLAVYGVPRELEFGLTFYRNQAAVRYEQGKLPPEEHLLIAPEQWEASTMQKQIGRRLSLLGNYAPQHLNFYWVSAAGQNVIAP